MWQASVGIVVAFLAVAGFVWYKLKLGAEAAGTVQDQADELKRQREKLEAEQAARKAKEAEESKARETELERIKAIKDPEARRAALLKYLQDARNRRPV